jgi:hypothetical protein
MQADDPVDVYRVWIPARRTVRASITPKASASVAVWGPKTVSLDESQTLRMRDLAGSSITGGAKGAYAYVEVKLTGRTPQAAYVLSVTASRR